MNMQAKYTAPETIDEYIASFPSDVQAILQKILQTIKKTAPGAEEAIRYGIPTFNLNGRYLIYFAAYKKHIGLYPVPTGGAEFNKQISAYQTGKGTLQFPLEKPIPYSLIKQMVKFSIKENLARAEAKRKRK